MKFTLWFWLVAPLAVLSITTCKPRKKVADNTELKADCFEVFIPMVAKSSGQIQKDRNSGDAVDHACGRYIPADIIAEQELQSKLDQKYQFIDNNLFTDHQNECSAGNYDPPEYLEWLMRYNAIERLIDNYRELIPLTSKLLDKGRIQGAIYAVENKLNELKPHQSSAVQNELNVKGLNAIADEAIGKHRETMHLCRDHYTARRILAKDLVRSVLMLAPMKNREYGLSSAAGHSGDAAKLVSVDKNAFETVWKSNRLLAQNNPDALFDLTTLYADIRYALLLEYAALRPEEDQNSRIYHFGVNGIDGLSPENSGKMHYFIHTQNADHYKESLYRMYSDWRGMENDGVLIDRVAELVEPYQSNPVCWSAVAAAAINAEDMARASANRNHFRSIADRLTLPSDDPESSDFIQAAKTQIQSRSDDDQLLLDMVNGIISNIEETIIRISEPSQMNKEQIMSYENVSSQTLANHTALAPAIFSANQKYKCNQGQSWWRVALSVGVGIGVLAVSVISPPIGIIAGMIFLGIEAGRTYQSWNDYRESYTEFHTGISSGLESHKGLRNKATEFNIALVSTAVDVFFTFGEVKTFLNAFGAKIGEKLGDSGREALRQTRYIDRNKIRESLDDFETANAGNRNYNHTIVYGKKNMRRYVKPCQLVSAAQASAASTVIAAEAVELASSNDCLDFEMVALLDDYILDSSTKLGGGSYSTAYNVKHADNGNVVDAVAVVRKSFDDNPRDFEVGALNIPSLEELLDTLEILEPRNQLYAALADLDVEDATSVFSDIGFYAGVLYGPKPTKMVFMQALETIYSAQFHRQLYDALPEHLKPPKIFGIVRNRYGAPAGILQAKVFGDTFAELLINASQYGVSKSDLQTLLNRVRGLLGEIKGYQVPGFGNAFHGDPAASNIIINRGVGDSPHNWGISFIDHTPVLPHHDSIVYLRRADGSQEERRILSFDDWERYLLDDMQEGIHRLP